MKYVKQRYQEFKEQYLLTIKASGLINNIGSCVGLLFVWWSVLNWFIHNYQKHSFNLKMVKRVYMARTTNDSIFF